MPFWKNPAMVQYLAFILANIHSIIIAILAFCMVVTWWLYNHLNKSLNLKVILQEWLPLQASFAITNGMEKEKLCQVQKNSGYQESWTGSCEQSIDGSICSSAFQPKFDCKVKIFANCLMQCVYHLALT